VNFRAQAEEEAASRVRAAVEQVAGELAEYIEPAEDGPTEEAVAHAAAAAHLALDATRAKVAELASAEAELATLRSILAIPPERPVVAAVAQLMSKASWERWARRMQALATDNFTLARTPEEIQVALEEALLATQRQSSIARKLEVLRFEKRLLISKKTASRSATRKPPLKAAVIMVRALKRLQKLNGNSQFVPDDAKPLA
jgi:hypothetical protein